MNRKAEAGLNAILCQFNPYHDSHDQEGLKAALAVNAEKRQAFNDLLINILEDEDFQDEERLRNIISFARDFNNFLKGLDDLYRTASVKVRTTKTT